MLLCLLAALIYTIPSVSAEKKIFHATGEYTMSDYETPAVAEQRALSYAKQRAAEQAGVYVDTYTKMEKVQVMEDRVNVLVSGVMHVTAQNIEKKKLPTGDIRIVASIMAEVDSEDLERLLSKYSNDDIDSESMYRQLKNKIIQEDNELKELKNRINELKKNRLPIQDLQIETKVKENEFISF